MRLKFHAAPAVALAFYLAAVTGAAAQPSVTWCGNRVILPNGAVGVPWQVTFSVPGATAPVQWSLSAASVPWAQIPPNGDPGAGTLAATVSGTPNTPTDSGLIEITWFDAAENTGLSDYIVQVGPAGTLIITTPGPPPSGSVGVPYQFQVTANGGTPPLMWYSGPPALPAGLSITGNGKDTALISGTPTQAGPWMAQVHVEDANVSDYGVQFFCSVINSNTRASISYPAPLFPPTTTTPIDLTPTLTGAASATWSVAPGSTLPPGLTLNPATGELTGNITIPDSYTFTIQAAGASTSETINVTVPCDCDSDHDTVSSAGAESEVNTATGGVESGTVDMYLGGGPLTLYFAREYSTELVQSGFSGALGPDWMDNFEARLAVTESAATVTLPGGKKVQFLESGSSWVEQAPQQIVDQLVNTASGYQFVDLGTNRILDFSGTGALTGIEDRNGNELTVTQGPNGPTSVSDGLGRTLNLSYNAAGRLIEVSDQTGRSILFGYTGANLTSFTDANGGVTSYSYTGGGALMTLKTLPVGNTPATYAYSANSQVQTIADSFQNTTAFSYNANAGQTTITDARGNQQTDTNLDSYVVSKQTDALKHSSSYAYDSNFHLTSFTDRLGNQTTATYPATPGYPASVTDAEGNTTRFTFAAQNQGQFTFYNLTTANFADGTSVSSTYDNFGNRVSATDQAGNVSTFTYNSRGQVLTATNPAGGVTTLTYNSDGTTATVKDPAGNVTTYGYDTQKRVTRMAFADGTTRSFTYDALNRLLNTTDERAGVTALAYDANSNLKAATDPLQNSATAAYDTDDRVSSNTDPLGKTTTYQYDPVSNLAAETNAAGEKWTYSYDTLNRVTSVADPAGFGPSFTYDAEGRVTAAADALSNTSTFVIDQLGRAIQATTPLGENYSRIFDSLGRVTSVTNPLLQVTNLSYESRGLLSGIAAPLGIAASFAHDNQGLLSGITDPNGNTWARQNDSSGRLMSATDPLGRTTTFTYDQRNRLLGLGTPLGTAQITRDAAGNATQIQYSDGALKNYTYDADNRIITGNGVSLAYDADGRLSSSNGLAITRDAVGRITGVAYASGKTVAYTYNSRGLLATVSDWANGSITFTYDNDGRVISVARSNGVTTQYAYDKDGRTASISEASGSQPLASIALQRDAAGKVTSAARNVPEGPSLAPGAIGFSYDAAEQISGESYDALGRLTNGSVRTYTWDLASELKAYSGSNGSGSFAYDGFGMRTSATEDGTTQDFVWNYALGLPSIATVQSGGADQRYYIYSPGGALLYAIDAAGNVRHWYHFDETGSTTFLTGDTGQVTDSYGITPYGEDVTAAGSTPNPFAWLGQWGVMQEGATGLYYMRARYYDSASARFLTRDPLLSISPRAINPYQYAIANPMRYVDPAGTDEVSVAWEWVKGFWQGVGEGVTVVSNALTFGLDASLSREANEITQNNGSLGTAQKWTAGIGAGAFWAAAGLAVAAETGVTTIGNTVIGGGTTVTATGTATAAGTIAVTQIVSNPEVTTETAQLTEIVFPEVGTETADTVVAVENGSISLSEQLQRAWTQFRDIVAGFPTGVDNRQRLLCAEEQIARDLALPADWVGIEEKELSFCGTSLYAPPEQWQDSYIRFRFPDLFRDTEILPYKLCTGGTELVP